MNPSAGRGISFALTAEGRVSPAEEEDDIMIPACGKIYEKLGEIIP